LLLVEEHLGCQTREFKHPSQRRPVIEQSAGTVVFLALGNSFGEAPAPQHVVADLTVVDVHGLLFPRQYVFQGQGTCRKGGL